MMKDSSLFVNSKRSSLMNVDKLSILFILLALILGAAISLAVFNFGWVTIIVLPVVALVFATIWNPNLGLASLIILIFIQLQRVVTEFHDLPGPGQPLVAFLLLVIAIRVVIFNERPASWIKNSFILGVYLIFLITPRMWKPDSK